MVYLIRHGQTAGNRKNRYIGGRTDEPLCPEGEAAARAAGRFEGVKKVYVSPMLRARRTAELLFPNAEQVVVELLREMDFGDFEDRSANDMERDADYRAWVDGMCEAPCPHGESKQSFADRVQPAFLDILQKERGNDVVIVAHGGTLMAIMHGFARPWRDDFDWLVENCHGWMARPAMENGDIVLTDIQYIEKLAL